MASSLVELPESLDSYTEAEASKVILQIQNNSDFLLEHTEVGVCFLSIHYASLHFCTLLTQYKKSLKEKLLPSIKMDRVFLKEKPLAKELFILSQHSLTKTGPVLKRALY